MTAMVKKIWTAIVIAIGIMMVIQHGDYVYYEDGPSCICEIGEQEPFGIIRNDGIRKCADGKSFEVIKEPNETPLVFINTNKGSQESGDVNLNTGEEFEVEVKFLCPSGDCNVEIN